MQPDGAAFTIYALIKTSHGDYSIESVGVTSGNELLVALKTRVQSCIDGRRGRVLLQIVWVPLVENSLHWKLDD